MAKATGPVAGVENVSLLIHNGISTKYAQREDSYAEIADVIASVCDSHVGNYLVFFPSYAYLSATLEHLKEKLPERQLLVQDRGMTEAAREEFLAQFSAGREETLIGLANPLGARRVPPAEAVSVYEPRVSPASV